jgi:hypothetical protein
MSTVVEPDKLSRRATQQQSEEHTEAAKDHDRWVVVEFIVEMKYDGSGRRG